MFGQGINFGTLAAAQAIADFLVIAGGASGGRTNAGGGGAGGLRTSYGTSGGGGSAEDKITLTDATTYTFTVGSGGAALTSNGVGNNGVDSSIAASGLTTITSVGGGGGFGSSGAASAGSGGSGGGAGTNTSNTCLLYTSPSPRDATLCRIPCAA